MPTHWARPSPTRRWQRSSGSHGRWAGAHPQAPHQDGSGDQEDHARHGAHRGESHRPRPGARARGGALQRADHRGREGPRGRGRRRGAQPAARVEARGAARGLPRAGRRPWLVWRLQLLGPAGRGGRGEAHRARGQGVRPDLGRSQGRDLLPLPRVHHRCLVHRLLRAADVCRREGDRRERDGDVRAGRDRPRRDHLHAVHQRRRARGAAATPHPARPCRGRGRRRDARGGRRPRRASGVVRVRAVTRRDPRQPAAALRRGPHLRRAAQRRRRPSKPRASGR